MKKVNPDATREDMSSGEPVFMPLSKKYHKNIEKKPNNNDI